jgi:hypothetical protein
VTISDSTVAIIGTGTIGSKLAANFAAGGQDFLLAGPRHQAHPGRQAAVLVMARGGNYRPGTFRQGWDHATGWPRRILADVRHLDLKVVEAEFPLVGANPALDQFKDLAHRLRQQAEEQARRSGRELGAHSRWRTGRGSHRSSGYPSSSRSRYR